MMRVLLLWFLVNLDFVAFVSWRAGYITSGFERSHVNGNYARELNHNDPAGQ